MHVLVTGAGGTVGRFITRRLLEDGHRVTVLGRRPLDDRPTGFCPYDLAEPVPCLPEADALVHCALFHVPGKFRGGEGDDPERFQRLNVEGTRLLFQAARKAGCRQAVFLSSRAVYGDHRQGEILSETDPLQPSTLYGQVKVAGEEMLKALTGPAFQGTALRATGIYGHVPGRADHKWTGLFKAFFAGEKIAPRRATEVHGEDLAAAVSLVLERADRLEDFETFNVSDLLLDLRELLEEFAAQCGRSGLLPATSSATPGIMDTAKLEAQGWQPGGRDRLKQFLRSCVREIQAST